MFKFLNLYIFKYLLLSFPVLFFVFLGFFAPQKTLAFTLSKPVSGPTVGLVGWWSFDGKDTVGGTIYDRSGNGNNGSAVNYATSTFFTFGKIGQALNFDGADDYVNIPDSILPATADFSISAWFKTSSNSEQKIISNNNGGDGRFDFKSASDSSGYKLFVFIGNVSGNFSLFGTSQSNNGIWHHGVVTRSGNTFMLFIDGSIENTSTSALAIDNTKDLQIGLSGNGIQGHKGSIDDVRIYNRALSASEIKQLYNIGSGSKQNVAPKTESISKGLLGWWTFDGKDISNGRVNDVSGNGNHGNFMSSFSTSTGYVMGKIGQAVNFQGLVTNNGITIAGAGVNVGTSYTFATWVNWRNCSASGYCVLMESKPSSDPGWYIRTTAGNVQSLYTNAENNHYSATAVPSNSWHHVAVVNNAGTVNFYMDGVKDANSYTGQPAGLLGCIGSNTVSACYAASDYSDASFDDFRAYNRALSASEIKQLYNMGAGTKQNVSPKTDPLARGLVGYWSFDGKDTVGGTIYDRSGNNNHGSAVNYATSTFFTLGKIGQALNFDGVDDYVRLPASSTLVPNVNTWTISFWFKASQIGSASLGNRMIAILNSAANSLILFALGSDNQLKFFYRNATPSGVTNIVTNVSTNTWYHAVATYNGTSYLVYVNGASPTTYTDTIDTASTDLALFASSNPPPGNSFSGKIDDVRIYNRALSASEVLQLYNMGR